MARLTKSERNEIIAAYRAGGNSADIGRKYGVNPGYVRKLAARNGVAPRQIVAPKPRPPGPKPKRMVKPTQATDPHAIGSGRRQSSGYTKLM